MPRPILHYQFGCIQGRPDVVSSGPLLPTLLADHQNPPLCHYPSNGVVGHFQSAESLGDFLDAASDSMTIELWLTMNADYSVTTTIFSFSRGGADPLISECHGSEMTLAQHGHWLVLRYWERGHCRAFVLRQKALTPGRLQQVVLVWSEATISIYIDGSSVVQDAPNGFDPTMSLWNRTSSQLHIMGTHGPYSSSMSMISVYNQRVSEIYVAHLYSMGKDVLERAKLNRLTLAITPQITSLPSPVAQAGGAVVELDASFDSSWLNSTTLDDFSTLVEISSLPTHGSLSIGSVKSHRIKLGDRISHPYTIHYWSDPHYFNVPGTAYNGTKLHRPPENFTYRILVVEDDEHLLLAATDIIVKEIKVVHVNHPPILKLPKNQTLRESSRTSKVANGTLPVLEIEGTEIIDDLDMGIDRLRVDIIVEHGTLTLATYENIDFTTCRLEKRRSVVPNAAWGCQGSQDPERALTFVATPSSASLALSRILYTGFRFGQPDELLIRIYDGSNGACLSTQEHGKRYLSTNSTVYPFSVDVNNRCFETTGALYIPPLNKATKDGSDVLTESSPPGSTGFGLADGLFYAVLLFVLFGFAASLRMCIKCVGTRGTKVHVEDADAINGQPLGNGNEVV